jgi:multiple sugar transport system substrate-binding protein
MKTKYFVLLALLLAATMALSGCTATPAAPAESAAQPAASGAVTLQLMGWASSDAENVRLQEVVDGWNAANPDIQVKLNLVPDYDTKLQTSLAGGAPPDVFYVDSFKLPDLVAAGALLPIGDSMTEVDDFYPSLREAFTVDGTFYCPPKDFSTLGLEYNTDLFDAAGLEYPTAEWTWDDLRAAAEALTDKDAGVVGLTINPDFARWIAFLYQSGGEVANADFTAMELNSPEALAAMEFYVGLVRDGYAAPASDLDSGWPGEAFGKGLAAMTVEGNWIVPFLKDQFPDLKYGLVELPAGPAGKATMAFTVCYGVAADGKNTEAATKVVDYLTGPEGMKAWTDLGLAMPTRTSLRDGWLAQFSDLEPMLNGADYARKWQFRPGFQDVLDTMNAGLQEAFTGGKTAQGVLDEAQAVGEQVLAR